MNQVLGYRKILYDNYTKHALPLDLATTDRHIKYFKLLLKQKIPSSYFASSSQYLDLGCGQGTLLLAAKELGCRKVKGVDASSDQLRIASNHKLPVIQDDVLDFLSKCEERYDIISAMDLIEHFSKDEVLHFFEKIKNRLNDDGILLIQTPNAASPFGMSIRYSDLTHEIAYTPFVLRRLLEQLGFTDICVTEVQPLFRGYSLSSTVRFFLWKLIRQLFKIINYVETGSDGGNVFTRNLIVTAKLRR